MKNSILFVFCFLIICTKARSSAFAYFSLTEETAQLIAKTVQSRTKRLVTLSERHSPDSPEAKALVETHATLDETPKILDFGLRRDKNSGKLIDESRKGLHISLDLQSIPKGKIDQTCLLIKESAIHATKVKIMGRHAVLSLEISPPPQAEQDEIDLITRSINKNDFHVSILKINSQQREFLHLTGRQLGASEAKDAYENLCHIFREYLKDINTFSSESSHLSFEKIHSDTPSSLLPLEKKSPLGKEKKPIERSSLKSENKKISPENSPEKIFKESGLGLETDLSKLSFNSPPLGVACASPTEYLAPRRLFPSTPEGAPYNPRAAISASDAQTRRRARFEEEIGNYSNLLARNLFDQLKEEGKDPNKGITKRGISIKKSMEPLECLSNGIKDNILKLFTIEEKENFSKKNPIKPKSPLSSEDVPLGGLKTYLEKLLDANYTRVSFNKRLSSLIPDGEIWGSWIQSFNEELKSSDFPIILGDLILEF